MNHPLLNGPSRKALMIAQLMMRRLLLIGVLILAGCTQPIDWMRQPVSVALVSVEYDANMGTFDPKTGIHPTVQFAAFSGDAFQEATHESLLSDFLADWTLMSQAQTKVQIHRPNRFLNTSLMTAGEHRLMYEYMRQPYDPIDPSDLALMSGLARRLQVDAVCAIRISFAVYVDTKTLWDEYKDPYQTTVPSYRIQLQRGHEPSLLRTTVTMMVVGQDGKSWLNASRYVDTSADAITIDDTDLKYDGGVSPKWIRAGLLAWLADWDQYLSDTQPPDQGK